MHMIVSVLADIRIIFPYTYLARSKSSDHYGPFGCSEKQGKSKKMFVLFLVSKGNHIMFKGNPPDQNACMRPESMKVNFKFGKSI